MLYIHFGTCALYSVNKSISKSNSKRELQEKTPMILKLQECIREKKIKNWKEIPNVFNNTSIHSLDAHHPVMLDLEFLKDSQTDQLQTELPGCKDEKLTASKTELHAAKDPELLL
jgi:hypothetical protein